MCIIRLYAASIIYILCNYGQFLMAINKRMSFGNIHLVSDNVVDHSKDLLKQELLHTKTVGVGVGRKYIVFEYMLPWMILNIIEIILNLIQNQVGAKDLLVLESRYWQAQ